MNYRLGDEQLRAVLAAGSGGRRRRRRTSSSADRRVDGIESLTAADFLRPSSPTIGADVDVADAPADPDDIAILLFTSGTTGEPKAAVLRHRHLTSYILGTVEFIGAGEDEAALVSVPPYHIAGISAVLSSVYAGRRIVLPAGLRHRRRGSRPARDEAITHAMVVPTMLGRILDEIERERRCRSRRCATSPTAAAACRCR